MTSHSGRLIFIVVTLWNLHLVWIKQAHSKVCV